MLPFFGEIIGTAILILLGNAVVANVVLAHTKGNQGGWIVITFGWGLGVFAAVFMVADISGAHLNPAVTLALALAGKFPWKDLPIYFFSQMLGAMIGTSLVWVQYRSHYEVTEDGPLKRATFCTDPAIRHPFNNLMSEIIGTFVLILGVLLITGAKVGDQAASLGALDALPVGLLVVAIGLSLGGTTGYAINPARDLGPRIMHAILPIPNKASSDWSYAWVPVIGPIIGSCLATGLWYAMFS